VNEKVDFQPSWNKVHKKRAGPLTYPAFPAIASLVLLKVLCDKVFDLDNRVSRSRVEAVVGSRVNL